MEEKNNQKEELEREIEKLKEQVELERLRKERDELREKLKAENNGKYSNPTANSIQSDNGEDDDSEEDNGKMKGMLTVVLSVLAVVMIIVIGITVFRINKESEKIAEKIENVQSQEEKTEKEDNQKSDIEVVVSTPQTPGTATQGTGQNSSDPNAVIPQTPVSDVAAQGNQQAKPEEEIKDNQKSNVEVVVSSPQTPGTVPDATQNPVDPNLVIPENPISDATVQENQSVKPEEEIKKGTEYYTKSTKGPVNIRKTSSKNSPLQDELPDGVVLKFIGKEGKWYRVSYTVNNQTKEGFVHVSQIKKK